MQPQTAFAVADVKTVAKVLQLADVGTFGLFAVDFQFQLLFYELGEAVAYSFGGAAASAEYHAVVGIPHKGMSAAFCFFV